MNPATLPGRVNAACHRCGGQKAGPLVPCKSCGFTPTGNERAIAWLFSEHHLSPEELSRAAQRVREGETPDPSKALRQYARVAMGAQPATDEAREPLRGGQLLALVVGNVVLTPMVGYAVWFGLREERPFAARQALRWTVPLTVLFAAGWVVMVARSMFP